VFECFYRAAAARGTPGSGLGLAIARQVADTHRGHVTAENPPGGGALFTLQLPESPVEA
jgi:two-component system, OmpR family, sensor histidine kinase MprB